MSIPEKDYDKALDRIEELEAELRIAKSFHDVAVKERNYERAENKRLTAEVTEYCADYRKRIEELEALLKDADEAHDEIQEELSAQVAENKQLRSRIKQQDTETIPEEVNDD